MSSRYAASLGAELWCAQYSKGTGTLVLGPSPADLCPGSNLKPPLGQLTLGPHGAGLAQHGAARRMPCRPGGETDDE